jgi:hypothetical protein
MTDAPSLPPHHERRQILATRPNPRRPIDYLVELQTTLPKPLTKGPVSLVLSYVPDSLILDPNCLDDYLTALAEEPWETLEAAATAALEDIINELVARWTRLQLTAGGKPGHTIILEDRQPNWENAALLNRNL